NEYGLSSAITEMTHIEDLSIRAESYGFPGITIDGNDLLEVVNTAEQAVSRARGGEGPTLIEAKTYRYNGHSKSDKQLYRTDEEVSKRKKKDPIQRFEKVLIQSDILEEKDIEQIKQMVTEEVEAATDFALASPEPKVEELLTDVYA